MSDHCYAECRSAERRYTECHILFIIMLNVIMMSVVVLYVFMLSVIVPTVHYGIS